MSLVGRRIELWYIFASAGECFINRSLNNQEWVLILEIKTKRIPKNLSIIWLHAVWSTKDRKRILGKSFRFKLFKHIKEYAIEKDIQLDIINGVEDHIHCLFRLKPVQNPSEVIKLIKGESSFWINKNIILDEKFDWQVGYGVFSVSERDIIKIRKYIYNQEEHHSGFSYGEELKKLVKKQD